MVEEKSFDKSDFELTKGESSLMISLNKAPVSILLFDLKDGVAEVKYVENKLPDARVLSEFKKQYGIFPSEYLLEELVRRGAKKFTCLSLSGEGTRLINAFLKRKRITLSKSGFGLWHESDLTERSKANLLRRRKLP